MWSECARLLGDIRPKYAIFENVTALLNGQGGDWFKRVLWDISQVWYDAEWHCIPASELGAHHHRDRIWIICYPQKLQRNGSDTHRENSKRKVSKLRNANSKTNVSGTRSVLSNTISQRQQGQRKHGQRKHGQRKHEQSIFAEAYRKGQAINAFANASDFWRIESNMGGGLNGFPKWLYGYCGRGLSYEESKRRTKTLQNLWCDHVSETLRRHIGGYESIQQAATLFSLMRQYEKGSNKARLFLEGKKTPEKFLRKLRRKAVASCSSHRPKHKKQQSRKHTNAMQMVPQLSSCNSETNWKKSSWEDGVPRVADGVPQRSHRLKCLENAVVPQIPELIGRAIMEIENERQTND